VAPPWASDGGRARDVEWSPDGTMFVTGGEDGRVGLWRGATGAPIGLLDVGGGTGRVAPSFDGSDVVVRTAASEWYRFTIRPADWAAFACAVAGRDLTSGEWRDALGDAKYHETCTN